MMQHGGNMLRKIVKIEEELCNGCGDCVPSCAEGAIQIIDGKARLISDLFCDGLGACIGHCPTGALTIEEREAEPYDEKKVMKYIVEQGENTIRTHLLHLKEHEEYEYLKQAVEYLEENGIENPLINMKPEDRHKGHAHHGGGCPGSRAMQLEAKEESGDEDGSRVSHLTQWPVQMHLISPNAAFFKNADMLLAADCVAFAAADFHKDFLKGKKLGIACPKLDSNKQVYLDKLISLIEDAGIKSLTVMIMQVPCCSGLLQLAQQAIEMTGTDIPLNAIVMGINGEILKEAQLN